MFPTSSIWVSEWGWATIPLPSFIADASLGIEVASSECELLFDKNRAIHLDLDAYYLIILENIQSLIVQVANMDKENKLNDDEQSMHRKIAFMEDYPLHRRTGSRDIASRVDE